MLVKLIKKYRSKINKFPSYCSWPVSVSWRCVNNRAMVFRTLHKGQRYTMLCPYLVKFYTLYPFILSRIRGSSVLIFPPSFTRCPYPTPPPLPAHSCSPLTYPPLRLWSLSRFIATFSNSEPSLVARLPTYFQTIPGWPPLTLPDRTPWRLSSCSSRPVLLVVLGSLGGQGGVPV